MIKVLASDMEELGLRGAAFPLPVNWRGDRQTYERDFARLPRFAEKAAVLGLHRTGAWVMPETPRFEDPADKAEPYLADKTQLHVGRIGAIARVLDRQGMHLGLEVIGVTSSRPGHGIPFVHRLGDLDRILGSLWNEAPQSGD